MSNRGKRGVSKGIKEYPEESYYISLNSNNVPYGETKHRFMTDFNRLCNKHLDYWKSWDKIDPEKYNRVWNIIKEQWNIPNDDAKEQMKKKANTAHRKFKWNLHANFVQTGEDPKKTYSFVDLRHWDEFVAHCHTREFQEKSAKAKESARKNTNPSRLGRTGYVDIEDTWRGEWDQLVLQHPWLAAIENDRSKIHSLGHLRKNKTLGIRQLTQAMEERLRELAEAEQKMKENDTYFHSGKDPLTEVLGKEHGGRTRGVSTTIGVRQALGWVKGKRVRHDYIEDIDVFKDHLMDKVRGEYGDRLQHQEDEMAGLRADVARLQEMLNLSPTIRGSSCSLGGSCDEFDDIEESIPCDLLWPHNDSDVRVAIGKVYSSSNEIPHESSIPEGYVKVQVHSVEEGFSKIPVPKQTEGVCHLDQARTLSQIIQWPRKKIKMHHTISSNHSVSRSPGDAPLQLPNPLPNQTDLGSSSCYIPQMEDLAEFQHEMPLGGYMQLLESQVPLLPRTGYSSTSSPHTVVGEPVSPQPSTCAPAKSKKSIEVNKRIKERTDKLKCRPRDIVDSAKRFMKRKKKDYFTVVAPREMYVEYWEEWVEIEAILDVHVNNKLDITFIHWWAMHLHTMGELAGGNKCVFLNPHLITSAQCRLENGKSVVEHIAATKRSHPEKQIYVAPYFQSEHWLLFLVCPYSRRGYILDSSHYDQKSKNNYYFPDIAERAFAVKFGWTMVKCSQQKSIWECGFYLMKFMYDIVINKQSGFPNNLWDDDRPLTPQVINQVALMAANEFFRVVVSPLDNAPTQ